MPLAFTLIQSFTSARRGRHAVFTAIVAPSRLRTLTFFGRVPKGATIVDVCKVLVQRFSQSVQDFGAGHFEVTFKSKADVGHFLADPTLNIRDVVVWFEHRGVRTKIFSLWLPHGSSRRISSDQAGGLRQDPRNRRRVRAGVLWHWCREPARSDGDDAARS